MLPSIEDAWNLPITAEMNSRQQQQMAGRQQQQQLQQRNGGGVFPRPPFTEGPSQAKRFKVEGAGEGPRPPLPSFYLTAQQLQMLQYLQQNQKSLNPQQQHLLQQLQNHYRLMQQHQQQLRLQQQQQQQQMVRPTQPFPPRLAAPQQQFVRNVTPQQQQQQQQQQQPQQQQQQQSYPNLPCSPALSSPSGVSVSDQELQALLSQKDIATSLAEDLLKQFAQGPKNSL